MQARFDCRPLDPGLSDLPLRLGVFARLSFSPHSSVPLAKAVKVALRPISPPRRETSQFSRCLVERFQRAFAFGFTVRASKCLQSPFDLS